jgi:DNA-binding FrmR family transcriptional regulator
MGEQSKYNHPESEPCCQTAAPVPSFPEVPDCCRHKHRDQAEYDALLKRLNRIEGQVRGVRGMVEKECYCTDILTQVSAIQSALNAFSRELLANHLRTCVKDGIRSDDDSVVDELVRTVEKLMK